MNRYTSLLCLLSLAAPLVCESAVYKCTGEDGQAKYQDTPCVTGQLQASLATLPAGRDRVRGTEAVFEPGPAQGTTPGGELAVGMSDTQVLNMRGWGRPQKITRTKGRDGWREEWTYLARSEEKRTLQFVNGTLAVAMSEPVVQEANGFAAAGN